MDSKHSIPRSLTGSLPDRIFLYLVSGFTSKKLYWKLTLPFHRFLFYLKNPGVKKQEKIFYLLTPPPRLSNIGDQAQAVAIRQWLGKHYPGRMVIEFNKDKVLWFIPTIKKLFREGDLIYLHSGGNMGDLGLWTERARREIVRHFPSVPIISLPQTISFSDTESGRKELDLSRQVYNGHPLLSLYARDLRSLSFAREHFGSAKTAALPDFVLSYIYKKTGMIKQENKVLLCLRKDKESIFLSQRDRILSQVDLPFTEFDTTIPRLVPKNKREKVFTDTLDFFSGFRMIVTDRYHGLIFAVLAGVPCIVLPTHDHKLTSAITDWFSDVPEVRYCGDPDQLKATMDALLAGTGNNGPAKDWNKVYFDTIKTEA